MKLDDFDFALPKQLIAQNPAPERDQSRMMVVWRETGRREHHSFGELPDILGPKHFLVVNNTRVFPARLRACRPGRVETIEILLLKELGSSEWLALAKPAQKAPVGQALRIGDLNAQVLAVQESGARLLRFDSVHNLKEELEKAGEPPLPPYIKRRPGQDLAEDKLRYQTVYARHSGSVAAPTAGLHFTDRIFNLLRTRSIPVCEILLHVGYGTFKPVRCENIEDHRMEPEHYQIDAGTLERILRYKAEGRQLVAVGSTTTRCLEFVARRDIIARSALSGSCDLFIYPGFEFKMVDALLTNFHLPRSTLFMLVCAFGGRTLMLDCYREAISRNYRFFSYGDCMLIL